MQVGDKGERARQREREREFQLGINIQKNVNIGRGPEGKGVQTGGYGRSVHGVYP